MNNIEEQNKMASIPGRKQERSPAWTQEAYRPPCREYSFCCPIWVPPPPRPDLARRGTHGIWVMLQSIMGYGYPPRCLLHGILGNVAKHYGIWAPTPCGQTDGWMDRHVSKHYLPVVLRTRAVITYIVIFLYNLHMITILKHYVAFGLEKQFIIPSCLLPVTPKFYKSRSCGFSSQYISKNGRPRYNAMSISSVSRNHPKYY